jgi:hypothetical protein
MLVRGQLVDLPGSKSVTLQPASELNVLGKQQIQVTNTAGSAEI